MRASVMHQMLFMCFLVGSMVPPRTASFSPPLQVLGVPSRRRRCLMLKANPDENYSETEIKEMRDLIYSLSLEPTDDDRRSRVKEVFEDALKAPNGMPKRFADLFDSQLLEIGDKVQSDAKKKFFASEKASPLEQSQDENNEPEEEEFPPKRREKTAEELQLWALVDMMVQTKTIVKANNGDLGAKGTFQ